MSLRMSVTSGLDCRMIFARFASRRFGTRSGRMRRLTLLFLSLTMVRHAAAAQDAVMATSVSPVGSGATSRISLDPITAKPATDGGLRLPTFSLVDDGSGPRLNSLMLQMPTVEFGGVRVTSVVGDQRLPAVFRSSTLAGPALASTARGLTFTATGSAPLSLSFGQMALPGSGAVGPSAFAAAAMSFTPVSRLSVTPQVLIPGGSPAAHATVGTAIRANVVANIRMLTDVGVAGTADAPWTPLASARLVGQWPRAGIETSVLRGVAAPQAGANTALVTSRDREAVQASVQPLPGLALAALTSVSRPSAEPGADDTTQGSLRIAYSGLPKGQLAATQQREATATRESDITSLEWQHRGVVPMTVRFVRQSASDSATAEPSKSASRVEVDLPLLAPGYTGAVDVRAALTAGSLSGAASGVSSKVSGRVALIDNAALTGETELGLTNQDGQFVRGLRLTTEMPVVPATRLQLSYAYRTGAQFPLGQVFEARILRRINLGR